MAPGDIQVRNRRAEHVFWLDAESCRWLADLVPAKDMFRQELLDAAESLEAYAARAAADD